MPFFPLHLLGGVAAQEINAVKRPVQEKKGLEKSRLGPESAKSRIRLVGGGRAGGGRMGGREPVCLSSYCYKGGGKK